MSFKKTQERAELEAKLLGYKLLTTYINSKTKNEYSCLNCNIIKLVTHNELTRVGRHCKCKYKKRNKTQQDAEREAKIAGFVFLDLYLDGKRKYNYKHLQCGTTVSKWPQDVRKGSGCPKCSGNFPITKERAALMFLNRGFTLIDKINSSSKPVKVNCLKCGIEFKTRLSNVKRGAGCPNCYNQRRGESLKLTSDEVKDRLIKMGVTIGPNFKYNGLEKQIEDIYFNNRKLLGRLGNIEKFYKTTGFPIGFNKGYSTADSWLGFVCSLASFTFKAYAYLPWMNGKELDGFDSIIKKAWEYNGAYWHKNKEQKDKFKIERCLENKIELLVIDESRFPKDRINQAKVVINFMYPDLTDVVIDQLKQPNVNALYHEWCRLNFLFDRIGQMQKLVKEYLLKFGLPDIKQKIWADRLAYAVQPSSKYYSHEIQELAQSLGYGSRKRTLKDGRGLRVTINRFSDENWNIYQNQSDAARRLKISSSNVSLILSGKIKQCHGHTFKYI